MTLLLVALVLAVIWCLLMSTVRYGGPFLRATDRIQGHLLEVLLYGAFPRVILKALGDVSRACASLTGSLLMPSLLFTLPVLAGIVLTGALYAHRPVVPGEAVLVWLRSSGNSALWSIAPPGGMEVEVDGFTTPDGKTRYWRLRPYHYGEFTISFNSPHEKLSKRIWVGNDLRVLSQTRHALGWHWLASPLEFPLLSTEVTEIGVDYPERTLSWHGWSVPWWLLLLLSFLGWSWLLTLVRGLRQKFSRQEPTTRKQGPPPTTPFP